MNQPDRLVTKEIVFSESPWGKPTVVRDRSELFARWAEIFPPAYVAKVGTAMTHDLFTRDGQAMIGDGEAWFDAGGAVSINPPLPH